ncbi:MAG: HsdM family class I SAM-dependent methyltransferase [Sedimentisphaerales bacterium]
MTNSLLIKMDFVRPDGKYTPGLVSVRDQNVIKSLSIDEQAVVFEARSFKRIDFVFFRRFSDSRSSQVAAYIVDNSGNKLDNSTLAALHHQVWLQGTSPLLYIAGVSQVDILACARGPDFWNKNKQQCQYKPLEFKSDLLTTAGQISDEMKKFSALRLADGTFWDDPDNRKLANHDKAAHQSLIQAIVETDKDINGENDPLQRRLLLLMILIKSLEDREVFPNNGWFGRYHVGAKSFFDVLKGGEPDKVYSLLDFLATTKFNGDVFDITKFSKQRLTKQSLRHFADLVEARTISKQKYLWDQYSFEHLPVEIISHIYQRFIKDGHGAVYTPPFLAALLLDQVMPYNKMTGNERILDPACGSGVFLVGAFKRLINFWKSKNNWESPVVKDLKENLKRSIFGIDLDPSAIDLTAFSLSLAICDALKPDVIWNELRFDRLRDSNLFEKDFFELLLDSRRGISSILENKFNIVIGNPPFESKLTNAAKKIDTLVLKSNPIRGKCPDNNLAYLFLEQALTLLTEKNGRVCMIQPSGLCYNRKPRNFRVNLFKKYCVKSVFDFTSIRNLYEADPKTVAVFACHDQAQSNDFIEHLTFRRTVGVKERICFEIDHYDHHCITREQAEANPYIWRANLLGGGRLVDISQRFQNMQTLSQYIEQKRWNYGEGFIVGKNGDENASFLTGQKYLPTKYFVSNEVDETKLQEIKAKHFLSPKQKEQFDHPLILIKENDSLPIAFWNNSVLGYKDKIVGIHAPKLEKSELFKVYETLVGNHAFYRFCCILNGTQSLVGKSTAILKQDIDILPYPKDEKNLSLSFWEKVLCDDTLNYMAQYVRLGQESDLLRKSADKKALCLYSEMFIKMLGSIYDNLKASNPIFLNGLICQPFYFGDSPKLEWLDKDSETELKKLIYYDNHSNLRTVRLIRFCDKNVVLIIKPDRLRYWIRSTAIRDADETLADLCNQGY